MGHAMKPRAGLSADDTTLAAYTWYRIKATGISVEFDDLDDFCKWAAESGYHGGMRLVRKDRNGPYAPDNCYWMDKPEHFETEEELAAKWDAIVKPIREQHREELDRLAQEKRKQDTTTVWQYEHPDLVREGIVFESPSSL